MLIFNDLSTNTPCLSTIVIAPGFFTFVNFIVYLVVIIFEPFIIVGPDKVNPIVLVTSTPSCNTVMSDVLILLFATSNALSFPSITYVTVLVVSNAFELYDIYSHEGLLLSNTIVKSVSLL